MSTELRWLHLNLPPTHRPLKALVYKEKAVPLLQYGSPQIHFARELRGIDFAANTTITFSELTWEEVLGSGVRYNLSIAASNVVNVGKNAGLQFMDANGEDVEEFIARNGYSYPLV